MEHEYDTIDFAADAAAHGDFAGYHDGRHMSAYDQHPDYYDDSNDQFQGETYQMPPQVASFITNFYAHFNQENIQDVRVMYDTEFYMLSNQLFKDQEWPPAEVVAELVDNDDVFLKLYKELYFRHVYSKLQPSIQQRFESWHNYCELFTMLLNANSPVYFLLPNNWMWDIIDEFVYQFQSFHQFRSKLKKTAEDANLLTQFPTVWSVQDVLSYLELFISKSKIIARLSGKEEELKDDAFANNEMYYMFGYFSIVGLLRVHTLLGDYHTALKMLDSIDMGSGKALFTRVTACHITVYYYLGFCYLMSRRYVDAIRSFQHILSFIIRMKQFRSVSYQYEQILKKNEQMVALLAITLSFCPQSVESEVNKLLKDKYSEKMTKMQTFDEDVFGELFAYSCPKFIRTSLPNYGNATEADQQSAYHLQRNVFMAEVKQLPLHSNLRSYLKLYSTIEVSKVATFLEIEENELRTALVSLKASNRGLVWRGGPPLSGELQSSLDIDFWVDEKDVIHITDYKQERNLGGLFLRHINKLDTTCKRLSNKRF